MEGLDENDARIEEEDTEEHIMTCSGYGAAPYLFEPRSEDIEQVADREVADPDEWRLANSAKCGQCRPMELTSESHCFQEHEHVVNKLKDMQPDPPACIAYTPMFTDLCVKLHVLEVAYVSYRTQYGSLPKCELMRDIDMWRTGSL
ncbi:hypothetical protein CAPTEDRAFT_208585 [Capitella teleta]|uniref:Uncharacterized protein n=1 Tax=Capitella teleta TaxID=283909 RepID=R7TA80_CAPTE|nr:hypothetical protein CAPTEDRAFT_208585 [Capitella teleta]|eukprot:ELT87919.1 hypothetical protein CAPTEDRAFT_208585 [Capitella teleta]